MKRIIKPATFLIAVAAVLSAAAVVWAYWSISSSGSAPGSVADLDTPAFTSVTPAGDTVALDWTTVTSPGGGAIDGYYVQRFAGTSTPSAACGSSASTLLSDSSCNDIGLASGTYTYKVTAVYNSWTAVSAESAPVVVASEAPPTGAVTFPADDSFLNAAAFGAGCSPTGICGTAADDDGVQSVSVSIQQGVGDYWNGTAFGSATEVFHAATLASPGATETGWNYALALPADGSYTVRVQAADGDGIAQGAGQYAASSNFSVDTVAPSAGALAVNGAAASQAGSSSYNKLGGYAIGQRTDYTDAGSGLASSTLTREDGSLSNDACSAFGSPIVLNGTPVQGSMSTGCYRYSLTGTDTAGNTASVTTTVKVDTVAPTGGAITANNSGAYNTTGAVALNVTSFVDAHSGISSNTITRASGTLSNDGCGTLSGSTMVTMSGGNDSATLGSGCYQYTLTGVDSAGNSATATSGVVKVDTTAPSTPSLAFSALTNAFYNTTSSVLFFGPNTGGFTVTASSADADTLIKSGDAGYTFNSTLTAPTQTGAAAAYTFTASSTSGSAGVVATNRAGANSASAGYTLTRDAAAPTGGAITANGGNEFNTTGTVAVSVTNYADSGSGIATNSVTRATATLSGTSCGTFSGSTAVTLSGGNDSATLASGCYQYTLNGTDNVGNSAAATSTVVKVDTTAPTSAMTFPGDMRYYATTSWSGGCSTTGLCGTVTDTASGVTAAAVSIQNVAGLYWNGTNFASAGENFRTATLGSASNGVRSWNYAMASPGAGTYTIRVRSTDAAGHVSFTSSKVKLGTVALAITGGTNVPTNHKATLSGTAGTAVGDATTVTVKICSTTDSTGPVPNFSTCSGEGSSPFTSVSRNATTGAWTAPQSDSLGNLTWHYAQVSQTDTLGNTWTFTTAAFQS